MDARRRPRCRCRRTDDARSGGRSPLGCGGAARRWPDGRADARQRWPSARRRFRPCRSAPARGRRDCPADPRRRGRQRDRRDPLLPPRRVGRRGATPRGPRRRVGPPGRCARSRRSSPARPPPRGWQAGGDRIRCQPRDARPPRLGGRWRNADRRHHPDGGESQRPRLGRRWLSTDGDLRDRPRRSDRPQPRPPCRSAPRGLRPHRAGIHPDGARRREISRRCGESPSGPDRLRGDLLDAVGGPGRLLRSAVGLARGSDQRRPHDPARTVG